MKKWEYMKIYRNIINVDSEVAWLNEQGRDGWELVTVDKSGFYYFKREIK